MAAFTYHEYREGRTVATWTNLTKEEAVRKLNAFAQDHNAKIHENPVNNGAVAIWAFTGRGRTAVIGHKG
jgi:hypothetical protein